MFDQTVQTIKARNANTDPDELQTRIDETVREVRKEMSEEMRRAASTNADA